MTSSECSARRCFGKFSMGNIILKEDEDRGQPSEANNGPLKVFVEVDQCKTVKDLTIELAMTLL